MAHDPLIVYTDSTYSLWTYGLQALILSRMGYAKDDQHYLRALGRRIRQLREEKRWSQEEFAFQCDLHRTYVGDVERGERNIAVLNLRKIAQSLGVRVQDLFPPEN